MGALMQRGIRLIGNGQAPAHLVRHTIPVFKALTNCLQYWEKLLGMVEKGEIDPLKMVSHRVRIEDIDKVYYKFDKKEDGMQKVFVQTRFSAPPCQGSPSLTTYIV